MVSMPDRLLAAIDRLATALERFREAYEAWLRADPESVQEREQLLSSLAEAERQLEASRAELDDAQQAQRI